MRFAPFRAKDDPGSGRGFYVMLTVALVFLLLFSGAVAAPRQQTGTAVSSASLMPNVYFSPDPIEIGVGSTRDVNIVVENVEGLYAIELRISFPNSLAQVVDADPAVPGVQIRDGDIFNSFQSYTIQNSVNNATGQIEYIRSVTGSQVGKDGGGIIATISLRGVAAGQGVMAFVEVVLCERDGTSISATYRDSRVNIAVVSSTSTPTVTPPPGATPTLTHTPGPSPTPTLSTIARVVPLVRQIIVGDLGIVQVEVANVCDLYGFEVRLDFNGARLDVQDANAGLPGTQVHMGNAFDGFDYDVLQNEVSDDGLFGQVHMAAHLRGSPPAGFCGTGILFWIVFKGVSVGWSNVVLSEVAIVDHSDTPMSRQLVHGQVEVLAQAPTITPSTTATSPQTATLTPQASNTPTPSVTGTPPTATPSPTGTLATPTNTSTPTLTPPPVIATPTEVCADRIVNGGFETLAGSEANPWVRGGNTIYTDLEHRTGTRCAWLGGYDNASDTLYQQVTIPSHPGPDEWVTAVTLNFWWAMITQEVAHPSDFMRVCIRDASGALLETLVTIDDGAASEQWQKATFDLTAYAGQTIRICFEATTNATWPTSFFVDDVSLVICEILQPTPTHTPSITPTISPTPSVTGLPTNTPTITPTPVIVTLQYTEGGFEGCVDSFLDQWQPATNYGHQGAFSIRTNGMKRPMIQFDLSSIPSGVTIVDARLWLYTSHYKSHAANMTVSLYGLKQRWVEMETTWERARSGVNWGAPGASDTLTDRDDTPTSSRLVSATNTWYDLDVTSLVQAWVGGTRANNGMLLIATGNTVEMSFWSSEYSLPNLRPKLVIQYIVGSLVPTDTPGPTTTGPAPTATVTPTPTRGGTEMIFQQAYLGYNGVTDTHISVWEPKSNFGGSVTLLVRQGDVRSALVRFDLSALPAGATIQEAKLGLYALERSNPNALNISVYQVLRSWAENQATWNLATSSTPWGIAGCNQANVDRAAVSEGAARAVNAVNAWHEWDITNLVRVWASSPGSNRGVILKGDGLTSVEYSFASSEYWWGYSYSPRLVVRYTTS